MRLSNRHTNLRITATGRLVVLAALLALGLALAQSPANDISFRSETYIVSRVTLEGGGTEERYSPATSAIRGQVVEYRIFATNTGETTLPAGQVQILAPIDAGMAFVVNSATPSSERLLTEFSIDGVDYSEPPLLVGEGDDRRVAEPGEYTMIRWTLLVPLEPGQEFAFVYRVTIE